MEDPDVINAVVPVRESRDLAWMTEQAVKLYRTRNARIHLLNVQAPLPVHVSRFFSGADLRAFHHDNGLQALGPMIGLLDEAGVPHKDHVLIGREAETIVRFAEEYHCKCIVLENHAEGWLSALGLGEISSQVRHLMRARHLEASLGAVNVL